MKNLVDFFSAFVAPILETDSLFQMKGEESLRKRLLGFKDFDKIEISYESFKHQLVETLLLLKDLSPATKYRWQILLLTLDNLVKERSIAHEKDSSTNETDKSDPAKQNANEHQSEEEPPEESFDDDENEIEGAGKLKKLATTLKDEFSYVNQLYEKIMSIKKIYDLIDLFKRGKETVLFFLSFAKTWIKQVIDFLGFNKIIVILFKLMMRSPFLKVTAKILGTIITIVAVIFVSVFLPVIRFLRHPLKWIQQLFQEFFDFELPQEELSG